VKRQPLSCFLLAGGAVWGKILRLLWHPGRGPHSSPLDGFGEVDIPGVQLVKLLISNSRHVV
jgi:hypothetical protein